MENDANPHSALIQPMDQNVIQNIKLGYRKLLLTNILNDPVHNENLEETLKNLNLKDVAEMSLGGYVDLRGETVTVLRYRDEILESNVRSYAGSNGEEFVLMDDNARPQRARLVEEVP
ncbi:hypothetical protein AVEN_89069-1 [Araneus ventricosus]|uniref:Uncharacterized protein n=1 Tax=Araneus ventricosus TaxID=182803 RepID=A0A4Y2B3G0_ARAVE|nr:hypothetical protein AVEN_89069-1 [Araneus ventricosus]